MNEWVVDERAPCDEWREMGDTGYCKNCGGQQAAHEPWLSLLFALMRRADA